MEVRRASCKAHKVAQSPFRLPSVSPGSKICQGSCFVVFGSTFSTSLPTSTNRCWRRVKTGITIGFQRPVGNDRQPQHDTSEDLHGPRVSNLSNGRVPFVTSQRSRSCHESRSEVLIQEPE